MSRYARQTAVLGAAVLAEGGGRAGGGVGEAVGEAVVGDAGEAVVGVVGVMGESGVWARAAVAWRTAAAC